MSIPKVILYSSLTLFSIIGVVAVWKKSPTTKNNSVTTVEKETEAVVKEIQKKNIAIELISKPTSPKAVSAGQLKPQTQTTPDPVLPNIDRVNQLFIPAPSNLPIVETVTYSSSVPWLKGKPAWIADYATFYSTSRHFIARSLNGKPDYFSQKVTTGSKFNVFRKDKHFYFYLLVDLSRCKLGFYYVDQDTNERVHLKTYRIGVGRLNPEKPSGCMTPIGKFALGSKTAVYKPGITGFFQDKKIELIRALGTRWIPFEQGEASQNDDMKGLGIQGAPWFEDEKNHQLIENRDYFGKYITGGCICVENVEELFAIVVSKPTVIEIVRDYRDAKLPGVEVSTPSR